MPSGSSPDVEGIRRTLSEIQRLAGTLAEADQQRHRQTSALARLDVYKGEGSVVVTNRSVSDPPDDRSASLPLITRIWAACGVIFVAGLAWYLSGAKEPAGKHVAQPAQSRAVQNDAAASLSGHKAMGAAGLVSIPAAPKSAEAAKPPADPPELAALDPALPRPVHSAPASPPLDGPKADSTSAAWQRTTVTVTSLLAVGRIAEARELLLKADPESDPDAAWALARTFDPRYVARIPGSDATPDVELATKWYRTWHALALAKGRISGDVVIERILRGMN